MLITCPRCSKSYLIDSNQISDSLADVTCLSCGTLLELPLPAPTAGAGGEPPAVADSGPGQEHEACVTMGGAETIPWENRLGFWDLKAYWQTTRSILLHPGQSFVRWGPPRDGEAALLFLLVFGSAGEVLADYWLRVLQLATGNSSGSVDNLTSFGLFILKAPLLVLLATLIGSLVIHFFLFLLHAANEPWKKTFALFAYVSGSLACLQLIPVVGLFVAPIWGSVASICGLKELHRTSPWRVAASFSLPLAILLLVFLALLLLIVGAGLVLLGNLKLP
jgi:predicted Zn finger-like uncharacterized protein